MTADTKTQKKTVAANNGQKPVEGIAAPVQSVTTLNREQLYAIVTDYLQTRHTIAQRVTKLSMTRDAGLTIEHEDA